MYAEVDWVFYMPFGYLRVFGKCLLFLRLKIMKWKALIDGLIKSFLFLIIFLFVLNRIFGGEHKVPPASKKVIEDLPSSLIGPAEAGTLPWQTYTY